jgi:hypothetical protein
MWYREIDLSDAIKYHRDYESWFKAYHCDKWEFGKLEATIFRGKVCESLNETTFDKIYEGVLRAIKQADVPVNPHTRLDYTKFECKKKGEDYIYSYKGIVVDILIPMVNGCFLSLSAYFIYLSYLYTTFGHKLIYTLNMFGSASVDPTDPKVLLLTPDNRHLYYANLAVGSRLSTHPGDFYVIGFGDQDEGTLVEGPYGFLAAIVGEGDKLYGENNFCTRAFALYYVINADQIKSGMEFYDWNKDATYNTYQVEASYVESLSYDLDKAEVCSHGDLFKPVEDFKQEEEKYIKLVNAQEKCTLEYYDLKTDIKSDKKIQITDMGPGKEAYMYKYAEKIHDGQVKNLMAYLEFLDYYALELGAIKHVYVVGCGLEAYMYTFIGYYFYDKKVYFVDKDLNKSAINLLPNCMIIEDYLPDDYIFEANTILMSDIFADDTRPEELETNLLRQMKWAAQCDFYLVKFALPWFEAGHSKTLKLRYDVRTLLPKSRFNASEMRLWGTKQSEEKILDYALLDRRICFFNRFNRFRGDICYDCYRIGKFFCRLERNIPSIIYSLLSDRGYEVWRFIDMYMSCKAFYDDFTRNETVIGSRGDVLTDFGRKSREGVVPCRQPFKLCNFYSGCRDCELIIRNLFDENYMPYLGILLDFNEETFSAAYKQNLENTPKGSMLKMIEKKYESILTMLRTRFKNGNVLLSEIDWGGLTQLDWEGNPVN